MRSGPHVFRMANVDLLQSYSPNGEYFAFCSADGTLRLWDTATGTVKQEYTPSSHLSATCSCLSWRQPRQTSITPKRKKKRRSAGLNNDSEVDLVALGTTSGAILIYSVLKGDIKTQLSEGGHSDKVNDVCWHNSENVLFSCSADQHIIQWNLTTGTVDKKWKADKGQICSICMGPSEHHLISAGRSIKVWDLRTKQVVKSYSGHATEVIQLLPASSSLLQNGDEPDGSSLPSSYFLSAASNDRVIHTWHTDEKSKEKNAVCSFSLPSEPLQMVLGLSVLGQSILLAVITRNGRLLIFEHILNGPRKKPLKPKITIQVATEGAAGLTPKSINVMGAFVKNNNEEILLCHGNFIKPTFEHLKYTDLETSTCLVRKGPEESAIRTETSVSVVRTPNTSDEVAVLGPGHMAPSAPLLNASEQGDNIAAKRKRKKSVTTELSLHERLNAEQPSTSGTSTLPKTDNLATILAQGLQSNDRKILNSVLQQTNDTIIRNTVRRLPVPVIVPLVKELAARMHGHAQSGHVFVKWMKTVLTVHTSYLMTFPELVEEFSGIYQMMDSRVTLFSKLSQLQGKLDLMLSQVTSQTGEEEETGPLPMLIYDDESSDDDVDEDLVADLSGVEDWEDSSDMDAEDGKNADSGAEENDAEMESDSD